ncbi:MAG: hypothetical protein ACJ70Y_07615 [Nitrososphaera sp.]
MIKHKKWISSRSKEGQNIVLKDSQSIYINPINNQVMLAADELVFLD